MSTDARCDLEDGPDAQLPLPPGFRKTFTLGAVGPMLIIVPGLLWYVPGLGILGSIRQNYVPMAHSTAGCFLILGTVLFRYSRPLWTVNDCTDHKPGKPAALHRCILSKTPGIGFPIETQQRSFARNHGA